MAKIQVSKMTDIQKLKISVLTHISCCASRAEAHLRSLCRIRRQTPVPREISASADGNVFTPCTSVLIIKTAFKNNNNIFWFSFSKNNLLTFYLFCVLFGCFVIILSIFSDQHVTCIFSHTQFVRTAYNIINESLMCLLYTG